MTTMTTMMTTMMMTMMTMMTLMTTTMMTTTMMMCMCVQTSQRCPRERETGKLDDRPEETRSGEGAERPTIWVVFWGNGAGWRLPTLLALKTKSIRHLPALGRLRRLGLR